MTARTPAATIAATALAAALAAAAIALPAPAGAAVEHKVPGGAPLLATAGASGMAGMPRLRADPSVADAPPTGGFASGGMGGGMSGGMGGGMGGGARAEAPARSVSLSVGSGQMVRLARPISGIFVADDKIADVQVKSASQIYLFAKAPGVTSVYATDRAGAVVWSSDVRVGANIADVGKMLAVAMPEARITATPVSGMLLLTGLVLAPKDAEEAQRLTELFVGTAVPVLNHIKVATPQQVSLQVKIAEVSRSVARAIGINYRTADKTGGFLFGVSQGRTGAIADDLGSFTHSGIGTTLGLGGKLLGVDIRQVLDLAETDGLVTTLAEPNLVAMSGETASFLAGGEIPIPQSSGLGTVSVEFKQYGVSLSFTPTVMSDGRISMRVRPEVSQLSDSGSVKLNGFTIPALTTRRVETTVELGSGQSFAIGGLLQNSHNNSTDKAPILGDLPVIGALFHSNSFRKQETELVIVVTPYLVKPVDAAQIALPTDGYRSATTAERVLLGRSYTESGGPRPKPKLAPGTVLPPVAPAQPTTVRP